MWPTSMAKRLPIFEGGMPKNKLHSKRKSIEPSISSGKENEKLRCDVIKRKGLY